MTLLKLGFAALLASGMALNGVAAAQSVDIKVTGSITPAACIPVFEGGATVDYGKIAASSLNVSESTSLGVKEVSMSISCDAKTRVAIRFNDNREGTVPTEMAGSSAHLWYGLGKASGTPIGGYQMYLANEGVTLDGEKGFAVYSSDSGETWKSDKSDIVVNKTARQWRSWSLTSGGQPDAFSHLNSILKVEAFVNKAEALPLEDKIQLDGLATIELVYL
ncbi:DUF1120 domain-containing protein [Achromobacter sp. Root565]|uniref:DUF1120 domain-containing protein n=1 Tax=Achromobacter sp. Root565 TaxID=1736564 RepID=UPI0006F5013F|nr:DUF1120 domain-containing protein [Achromobacter sp. Root565]KRA01274.1 hypothetical protein ASD71_04065 [Achromobacter sp. Root565]